MRRRIIRRLRRWLYVVHRWIGIGTCLLFAMWFMSGVVMMYVAFPQLTDAERWAALPSIAWDKVQVSPDRAMAAAGLARYPRDLRLAMLNEEPVYRLLGWDGERKTISAVDGRAVDHIAPEQALAVARHHPNAVRPELKATVERDQWSVTARFDPLRPFYLVSLGDPDGTELYISSRHGEIALDTTQTERVWNWLGSIPHWIYPTVLRKDGATWRLVVLWISGICMVTAVTGFWIGILRMRLRRRYASGAVTPYRGWMAWHHIAGLIGGVFVLTWMFSGWLSLNPGDWFAGRGTAREAAVRFGGSDGPHMPAEFLSKPPFGEPRPAAVEARFVWLGGKPLVVLTGRDGGHRTLDPATGNPAPLSEERIFEAAHRLMPNAALTMRQRLEAPDAYWYSHHQQRVMPVLRAGFDDDAHTWFHIDPTTGDILGRTDDSRRTYRWLFNALHSFDFALLIQYRPAWDVVVWLLSLFGLIVSVSGVVIGWRRLRH
ncbi:PepSY domain-containing protein [Afipia sp. GAS231]|uniref:PepSY domain-containing protein n=1 Tax=Afipia sp. GAS231 TaxID=1882747 RepID=UPI000879C473|nr:PepSY domain-containing protein [Afipia sp. GAS231]SDP24004.1 PepSY-associated TM region [Afipia sp. GAS231]